ncbi:MAG: aminoacetone oxidase family FAD-binding enzyme [Clostridia bacterium]|nr:aminoacetone oxidase family FAD-binding enzyme [Clostridia bacterium]
MTIVIVGGGASGMIAALTAAANKTNKVILLERQSRTGRKLMATGNGRCNLTNTGAGQKNYHGGNAGFIDPAMKMFPPTEVLAFFKSLGLLTVTEADGRVYPLSNSANSVADILRYALEQSGVEIRTGNPARELRRAGGGFTVTADEGAIAADAVVVAAGGAAGEKLGGVKDGYALLKSLGHSRTALFPSLVQITTENTYPRALKGVKADARLTLQSGKELLAVGAGELLFTDSGVSGPAAFDISRAVSTSGDREKTLKIDFLREYSEEDVFALLAARRAAAPTLITGELFTGALHNRIGRMVVKYAGLDGAKPLTELTDGELRRAAAACKEFTLSVRGTEGFQNAQVTAGGIQTAEFNTETLESRIVPGLFACGEVLDIDGDCGGYNLQWAWASGRLAGRLGK